jgi:hypothetical protein
MSCFNFQGDQSRVVLLSRVNGRLIPQNGILQQTSNGSKTNSGYGGNVVQLNAKTGRATNDTVLDNAVADDFDQRFEDLLRFVARD